MTRKHLLVLVSIFWLSVVNLVPAYAQDASPAEVDTAIAGCENDDECLAEVVTSSGEVRACFAATDPLACSQRVMEVTAPLCEARDDPMACFATLGTDGLEAACTYLPNDAQADCFLVSASESRDYSVVERRFPEEQGRDQAYAKLAVIAYDPTLIESIADNETYDLAYISVMAVMGAGQGTAFAADHCAGLRGNYAGDYPDDAILYANLCDEMLALVTKLQNASEADREQFIRDLQAAEAADDTGDALEALITSFLGDTGIIDIGYGEEWCLRPTHDLTICDMFVPLFHDTAAQTIQEGGGRVFTYEDDNRYGFTFDLTRRTLDGTITETVTDYMVVISEFEIERYTNTIAGVVTMQKFTRDSE